MWLDIEQSWKTALNTELTKDYFARLMVELQADYLLNDPPIYPPAHQVFNAFSQTPFDQVSVVVLGQDPYHQPGQAMGLSFSVPDGVAIPPSLKNIHKEIASDVGGGFAAAQQTGNLTHWATQGVLLLNTTLTVAHASPTSHHGRGWEIFTDAVITTINDKHAHVVFLLWGAHAGKKADLIDETKHLILTAAHPSPLSAHRGFFGCKHFSQCNEYLEAHGQVTINW